MNDTASVIYTTAKIRYNDTALHTSYLTFMLEEFSRRLQRRFWRYFATLPLYLHHIGLGILFAPFPFIVLTTRGRKSGLPRHVVLEWRRHGSRYYLVSIDGQAAQWYKNLCADPTVTVQNGVKARQARAYPVTDSAEALRALYMFRRHSPLYDFVLSRISSVEKIDFRTLTDVADEFTVVRLEIESASPQLPGVRARYPYLSWLLLAIPVVLWGLQRRHKNRPE